MLLVTTSVSGSVDTLVSVMDAHVILGDSATNYGDAEQLLVADPHESDISRAYVRFDLDTIPEGASVNWARLRLYNVTAMDECAEIGVYCVLESWDESTITWASQPDIASHDEFEDIVNLGDDGGMKWVEWNLTDLTTVWLSGSTSNNGIVVKVPVEKANWYCVRTFLSRESHETELRPELIVSYDLDGTEYPTAMDAHVDQSLPDSNFGSSENLLVVNASWEVLRTYVQFDLSDIPEGTDIYLAELVLENHGHWDDLCPKIDVHRVLEEWDEDYITWNSQPDFETDVRGALYLRDDFFPTGFYAWDVTELVQKWVGGDYVNYGMVLRPRNEGDDNYRVARGFYSREASGDYTKAGLNVFHEGSPGIGDVPGGDPRMRLACSPNPSNGLVNLRLQLAQSAHTVLEAYDAAGRLVRTIYDGELCAGAHRMAWDGEAGSGVDVASGTYFLRVTACGVCLTEKVMLVR